MLKAFAVLRTLYLLFVIGYTIRGMPFVATVARTFDEQYAICSANLHILVRAAWLAIAWIALETVLGWAGVGWRGRAARHAAAAPPAAPAGTGSDAPPRP